MQDVLVSVMVFIYWGMRQFLFWIVLFIIVNMNNVCQELERLVCNWDFFKRWLKVSVCEIVDVICQVSKLFQKVFVILVLLERVGYIFDMIVVGILDDCLFFVYGFEEEF